MKKSKGLTFDETGHKYHLDGRPVPSVSEIIGLMTGDVYAGIPPEILERAAKFGTRVHRLIEFYNEMDIIEHDGDFKTYHCLTEWTKLKKHFDAIAESEIMVHYYDLFAGTFDGLAVQNGVLVLLDYKTTAKLHIEKITIQLNLYRIAYEWKTGKKIKRLAAVWLPKDRPGKIQYVEMLDDFELINAVRVALAEKGKSNCTKKRNLQ